MWKILLRVLLQKNNHCREEHSCTLAKKIQARAMVPKHFIPAYSRMLHLKKKIYIWWPFDQHCKQTGGKRQCTPGM